MSGSGPSRTSPDSAHGVRASGAGSASLFQAIHALVASGRFDLTTEQATQAGIERLLLMEYAPSLISREHRLGPGDRPDFLVAGAIVVEVKGHRHQQGPVLRQLGRYAAYPEVEAILLATSRAMRMPAELGGKPVAVINLGRAWL